jgi:sulfatase maturation enzyme AslB (radical SAM superfamily)
MDVSFVTNVSRVGGEERRWLRNHGPLELWISFYGYPPDVHDRICGRRGAFGLTMTALATLIEDGHRIGVHYPLGRASLQGCADFVDRMGRSGVMGVKVMQLFDQGRARREYSRNAINTPELAALLPSLREVGERYPNLDLRVSLRSGQRAVFEERGFSVPPSVGCHAGLDSHWTTDVEGFVYPCCLFLNTASVRSVHLDGPDLDRASDEYGHAAFLRQIGRTSPLAHCPALDPNGVEESPEFICPLTYGRLVRPRRMIEPSP